MPSNFNASVSLALLSEECRCATYVSRPAVIADAGLASYLWPLSDSGAWHDLLHAILMFLKGTCMLIKTCKETQMTLLSHSVFFLILLACDHRSFVEARDLIYGNINFLLQLVEPGIFSCVESCHGPDQLVHLANSELRARH